MCLSRLHCTQTDVLTLSSSARSHHLSFCHQVLKMPSFLTFSTLVKCVDKEQEENGTEHIKLPRLLHIAARLVRKASKGQTTPAMATTRHMCLRGLDITQQSAAPNSYQQRLPCLITRSLSANDVPLR